jgi:hypothetical protein
MEFKGYSRMLAEVLSSLSVSRLSRAVAREPDLYLEEFDSLTSRFSLNLVQAHYQIEESIDLLMPEGFSQDKNNDTENCRRIASMIPNLSPAQATDERLWVTLAFGKCSGYMRQRWPFRAEEGDKLARHVSNHWFSAGVRGRVRDNGISRLWWMGYIANRVSGMDLQDTHEILFGNSDYRSSLLERSSSANSLVVLGAVLKLSKQFFTAGTPYKREPFRKFMMQVNFLGGRRNLAGMSEQDLLFLFEPIYRKAYEETPSDSDK